MDLKDASRLQALYEEAVRTGIVQACEANRLRVFALAEYAQSIGRTNPPGLFASLLRAKRWYATLADEDRAWSRIRSLFDQATPPSRSTMRPKAPPGSASSGPLPNTIRGLRSAGSILLSIDFGRVCGTALEHQACGLGVDVQGEVRRRTQAAKSDDSAALEKAGDGA